MPTMNVRNTYSTGVIFDLDGTLADTLDDLCDSLNHTLHELGYGALGSDRIRIMIGDGIPTLVSRAARTEDPDEIERITAHFRNSYAERMLARTRLYPGIHSLLDTLCEAGIPMGVLSNKSHDFTVSMGRALLSRWPICRIQGVTQTELRKPNPMIALEIAAELKMAPADMFFVGDSEIDIDTGHHAGMKTIAVTWGFRSEAELISAQPDHLVSDPEQVAAIVLA